MGLCVVVKEDQRIDEVFREFHLIVPLKGASILEMQGHNIGLLCPCPTWEGYMTCVGHGCMHVLAVYLFFEK